MVPARCAARVWTLLLAAVVCSATVVEPSGFGNLTRKEFGDTFAITGPSCGPAKCAEFAAGAPASGARGADACACACSPRAPLFREDRALCVDDISECSLANFGTGPSPQKIPFVFLPLKGQIIHPSRDINFPGVKTPICAVSGAQFLTRRGFVDLRNTVDADVPFTLFRDEGRTFLQWSGESELRARMTGRVMLVRLLCRDVWASAPAAGAPVDLSGVFTPCVAFRVQGSPAHHINNVSEVQFALNSHKSESSTPSGLTVSEYIAIGISSILLGMIYVASVFLYLHIRKRRRKARDEENTRQKTIKGIKNKNGTSIRDHDIIRINDDRVQSLPSTLDQAEDGVVKKNPLLNMSRQFHDLKTNYPTDPGINLSDSEDQVDHIDRNDDNNRANQFTSALVHPCSRMELRLRNDSFNEGMIHRDESGIERLPDEHVSIVDTTDIRDDKPEIVRPIGNTRRKLYFNPAYFEPHLMAEPPPAALEFLTKIREVITIAKHKMSAKRFQPVLNEIPEEETYQSVVPSIEFYQGMGSQRSGSIVSLKRENSRKRPMSCVGCPGCKTQNFSDINNLISYEAPACTTCLSKNRGDKQNSIRKWLEEIPIQQNIFYESQPNAGQNMGLLNSLLSLPSNDTKSKLRKQNSFSQSLYAEDVEKYLSNKKRVSTSSVRSEPITRNYNFPLPDFDDLDCGHNIHFGRRIATIHDTKPGFIDYRPGSLKEKPLENQHRNKYITNKNSLPDMVSEAIAIDSSKSFNHSSSDEEKIYRGRSQIQARKSPDAQGIDYETDSLERNSMNKGVSTPTEYAEVPSSQASPSLSAALPLEEELTMRNAVYKTHSSSGNSKTPSPNNNGKNNNNLYETISEARITTQQSDRYTYENEHDIRKNDDYSLVSEVYVNNNYNFGSAPTSPSGSECSMGSRKFKPAPEKPGCLTIVVQDPPENYIKIHESDGFEPDTLDRKHPKHKEILESIQFSRKDLINHINNEGETPSNQMIQLKSNGTFKRSTSNPADDEKNTEFNSLRQIYENKNHTFTRPKLTTALFSGSKSLDENFDQNSDDGIEWNSDEGRILTLEMRHSKRQRQCTPPSIKQLKSLVRPDVLPPLPPVDDTPIYEQPIYPPRKVDLNNVPPNVPPKNVNGRSLSPRTSTSNLTSDPNFTFKKQSMHSHPYNGPTCSPSGASVLTQYSDYENAKAVHINLHDPQVTVEACRNHNVKPKNTQSFRLRSKQNNEFKSKTPAINSNTYVKSHEPTSRPWARQKRGQQKEDSGYLSSDSTSSQHTRRRVVVQKHVSGSESDDTENEARSESGAESVETHSVFFGSLRKFSLQNDTNNSFDSKRSAFRRASSRKTKSKDKNVSKMMC